MSYAPTRPIAGFSLREWRAWVLALTVHEWGIYG